MKNYFDYLEENDKALFDVIIKLTPTHTFKMMLIRANQFEADKIALPQANVSGLGCPNCGSKDLTDWNTYYRCNECDSKC